jgi:hypothetical protein
MGIFRLALASAEQLAQALRDRFGNRPMGFLCYPLVDAILSCGQSLNEVPERLFSRGSSGVFAEGTIICPSGCGSKYGGRGEPSGGISPGYRWIVTRSPGRMEAAVFVSKTRSRTSPKVRTISPASPHAISSDPFPSSYVNIGSSLLRSFLD